MKKLSNYLAKASASFFAAAYAFIHIPRTHAAMLDFNLGKTLTACNQRGPDLEPIRCFILAVTKFALDLMGALAFIMILYASIIYLISYGDEAKAEIAKKTLIWSVIGIIAVAAAKSVLYIIYENFK